MSDLGTQRARLAIQRGATEMAVLVGHRLLEHARLGKHSS